MNNLWCVTLYYLKFKLYESPNAKMIIVPDKSNMPIIVSPGPDQPR